MLSYLIIILPMKDTKTKIALWVLLSFLSLTAFAADEATISEVNVAGNSSLEINFEGDMMLADGEITGDIKILRDVVVESAEKDFEAQNIVNIVLAEELKTNSSYSILSIFWADGSMDFSIEDSVDGVEILNNDPANPSIEKVIIKDATEIALYYSMPLESEEFEYKIFSQLEVENIQKTWSSLDVQLVSHLTSNSNYTIILISLQDMMTAELSFDDGLFDFMTGEIEVVEEIQELEEEIIDELNAAWEEGNVEEVALDAEETPDTGAETWVLILGTLLINTFLTSARKKKAKIA